MSVKNLTGVRASACVVCPRQGYYQGIGTPEEPLSDRDEALLQMRSDQNDVVVARHAAELRAQGHEIIEEVEIPWGPNGMWTAHGDEWAPAAKVIWEWTFTKDCLLPLRKARQVVFYADKLGAETAVVVSLDPQTGEQREYIIEIDTYREELREMERLLVDAIATLTPPPRVCKSPADGPARWCHVVGACFADVPEYVEIDPEHVTDPDVIRLAGELAEAIDARGLKNKDAEAADERVKELQAELATRLKPGVEYFAGPVSVKRNVQTKRTLAIGALEASGQMTPAIEEFISESKPFDRFYVKRLG